jgi:hypothetical protein
VQERAWREEIPQASAVSHLSPSPPPASCACKCGCWECSVWERRSNLVVVNAWFSWRRRIWQRCPRCPYRVGCGEASKELYAYECWWNALVLLLEAVMQARPPCPRTASSPLPDPLHPPRLLFLYACACCSREKFKCRRALFLCIPRLVPSSQRRWLGIRRS